MNKRVAQGNGNPLQCSCLENPRDGKPAGLPSMDRTESDTTEATQQQQQQEQDGLGVASAFSKCGEAPPGCRP